MEVKYDLTWGIASSLWWIQLSGSCGFRCPEEAVIYKTITLCGKDIHFQALMFSWTQRELAPTHNTCILLTRPCGRMKWLTLCVLHGSVLWAPLNCRGLKCFIIRCVLHIKQTAATDQNHQEATHLKFPCVLLGKRLTAQACSSNNGNNYTQLTSYIQHPIHPPRPTGQQCHHKSISYFCFVSSTFLAKFSHYETQSALRNSRLAVTSLLYSSAASQHSLNSNYLIPLPIQLCVNYIREHEWYVVDLMSVRVIDN